jgi:hypothetical protein
MYGYTVQVRRYDVPAWLPVACNTPEDAYAMVRHALGPEGTYHIARVAVRVGSSDVFRVVDTVEVKDAYVPAEDA